MSEVATYRQPDAAGALIAWADAAQAAFHLAKNIVATDVCPPAFRRKPEEATAVILLGAELGMSPVQSLRSMYLLRGQVGMYARSQVSLAQFRGHSIWTEAETDDSVTVAGHRKGEPDHVERVTWTIARARQAGFIRRGAKGEPSQYELQPRTMLWSRAAGDVARRIAADALAGIPELDDPPPSGAQAQAASPGRVVQRAQVDGPTGAESPPSAPAPVEPPRTVPDPPPPIAEPSVDVEPDAEPAEDVEPPMTRAQLIKVQTTFVQAGIRGPNARHEWLSGFLGREVESTNDLTVTEASAVIDALDALAPADAEDPPQDWHDRA